MRSIICLGFFINAGIVLMYGVCMKNHHQVIKSKILCWRNGKKYSTLHFSSVSQVGAHIWGQWSLREQGDTVPCSLRIQNVWIQVCPSFLPYFRPSFLSLFFFLLFFLSFFINQLIDQLTDRLWQRGIKSITKLL